ncbi:MAG: hypothetical protein IPH51_15160 [Rubrivivax sp.]|nr:hypothetical protein [Rubrivivax sp.]
MLKLVRQWLQAGVMEDGVVSHPVAGTPQGGVISPLLSNIYLHVLDRVWAKHGAHLGELVRYADDFRGDVPQRTGLRRKPAPHRTCAGPAGAEAACAEDAARSVDARPGRALTSWAVICMQGMSGRLWQQKGLRRYLPAELAGSQGDEPSARKVCGS